MRLAREGLLEPRDTFQQKRFNTYFTDNRAYYGGGVSDDHIPFLQRSKNIFEAESGNVEYC